MIFLSLKYDLQMESSNAFIMKRFIKIQLKIFLVIVFVLIGCKTKKPTPKKNPKTVIRQNQPLPKKSLAPKKQRIKEHITTENAVRFFKQYGKKILKIKC